ncbi:MAG: NTP transferase domain-containing protein [Clostridiales bacterium]|nr:NTP transferase domain-containing protein [Clostridiales bacterium]
MKAVIMAGGEGTRLRPLSLGRPKPMTPLFDKPVLEHIIMLLKKHHVTDICVTLQYMPKSIMDYFGDGRELGVSLTWFVEDTPLGTAGSVKRCMTALGGEDFLVLSGDAVCDLDLTAAMEFHTKHHPAATLILHRHPAPLEYGLVLTDREGRILRFIEKPSWGQVVADTVNTGIYILSARAMEAVPSETPYDFGGELFPRLLAEEAPLRGYVAKGYWCDMGDPTAYLDCAADALSGKVSLDLGLPLAAPGVWSASPIPETVSVVPPCWIGSGVSLGDGALIGPHTVLGLGSSVGRSCLVQRSVLLGASAGDRATLYGAILCPNASARRGSVLNEGVVLGEDSVAEESAVLSEGVKLWPGRHAPRESRLTVSLTGKGWTRPPVLGEDGILRGVINEDITPQLLLLMGGALGAEGKVGLGWTGGRGASMLSRAVSCGVNAAGGQVVAHDGATVGAAAWFAARQELPVSIFLEQDGVVIYLSCLDRRGLPLSRKQRRKLEGAVLRGEVSRVPGDQAGRLEPVTGVPAAYAADTARRVVLNKMPLLPIPVSVLGETPADRAMSAALETMGFLVSRRRVQGQPAFAAARGGRVLLAWDENGTSLAPEGLLTLLCFIELKYGGGRVALPSAAPMSIELLAEGAQDRLLRLGRDGPEAEELYAALPWLWDATFAAGRICARLGTTGEPMSSLMARLPRFAVSRQEIPLSGSRGAVMRALAGEDNAPLAGDGLRLAAGDGWVYLSPLSRRAALRVVGEGPDAEIAAELCDFYAKRVADLDQKHASEK